MLVVASIGNVSYMQSDSGSRSSQGPLLVACANNVGTKRYDSLQGKFSLRGSWREQHDIHKDPS